ncbi:MAG: hypothetical protein PHI28_12580, partial [Mangrovibacterium sp.]|nr:hypothetical protein [Mangrovibacterium sp.]
MAFKHTLGVTLGLLVWFFFGTPFFEGSAQTKAKAQKGKAQASPVTEKPDFIEMKLPMGQVFETWEQDFRPKKTYHVAQRAKNASDENNGSENAPFKTIS